MAKISLRGSERVPMAGARAVARADSAERIEVSIIVRRRSAEGFSARVHQLAVGDRSSGHMQREEFAAQFGADVRDLQAVKSFAAAHGLTPVQEHVARRTLIVSGTVAQFESAFDVQLHQFEHDGGSYRGRQGTIRLPSELDGIIEAVLGLDNRPQARPHFRPHAGAVAPAAFTPPQLAALYQFPAATGQGECVAIIELGGGFRPADLKTYFTKLKVPHPTVTAVSVDHGKNAPTGAANGADGEVMLDIEVVGSVAPKAHIAVYFAPNTDAGFLDAVTTAIHDTTNKPSVISISWGSAESTWSAQAMTAMDSAFQAAAAIGISVCVAAGDNGSSDGVSGATDHVDFPASSPYALACGGTSLRADKSGITEEVVWNDGTQGGAGGGGVSGFFALPPWQRGARATRTGAEATALAMRGVPDIAGDADPQTGYDVRIDGTDTVIGGTSAVAPLWAALLARINQLKGTSVGYVQPQLYKVPTALRDIVQGNNGDFAASGGWDACTGLGSPNGQKVSDAL